MSLSEADSAVQVCSQQVGVVVQTAAQWVEVRIEVPSACHSCQASAICGFDSKKPQLVTIACDGTQHHVGEQVEILAHPKQGLKAALWAYCLPFLLLVATILLALGLGASQGLAALVGLLILIPYFLLLHAFSARLGKSFSYQIQSVKQTLQQL